MPFLALLTALSTLSPGEPVVAWSFSANVLSNGLIEVALTAKVEEGWHIYATKLENDLGPIPTSVRFEPSAVAAPVDALSEPQPEEVYDPNFEMQVRYHSGSPRFVQLFKPAGADPVIVKGEVEFMVCNDKTCLPPEVVPFTLQVESVQKR